MLYLNYLYALKINEIKELPADNKNIKLTSAAKDVLPAV
jgi:hypothetical protein